MARQRVILCQFRTVSNRARQRVSLLRLRQDNGAIEDYVVEFLELSNQVDFNEVALKEIFRVGLNEPIYSGLPGGKIHFHWLSTLIMPC